MKNNKKISAYTLPALTLSVLAFTVNTSADDEVALGENRMFSCYVTQGTDENMIKNYHGQVATPDICHMIHNLVYHGIVNTGSEIINHVPHPNDVGLQEDTDQCGVIVTEIPLRQ